MDLLAMTGVPFHVSIHTPVWGVTKPELFPCRSYVVSIHTPVWGVTELGYAADQEHASLVSIHTPVWGVTQPVWHPRRAGRCFNPHPRMGGDRMFHRPPAVCRPVSIHTPVWGVTREIGQKVFSMLNVSIHTPVWGVTVSSTSESRTLTGFNPHPRMGG